MSISENYIFFLNHSTLLYLIFFILLQKKVEQRGLPFVVVNAGVSGDTTSGGLRRINWVLRQPADVLVIALGGNDGLRGIPPSVTQSNLCALIDHARELAPGVRVILAGMQMPPSMGEDYTKAFRELFPEVAQSRKTERIPFLLEGVGGRVELNQLDLIHPTAEGQRIVAANVWKVLDPILDRSATR